MLCRLTSGTGVSEGFTEVFFWELFLVNNLPTGEAEPGYRPSGVSTVTGAATPTRFGRPEAQSAVFTVRQFSQE